MLSIAACSRYMAWSSVFVFVRCCHVASGNTCLLLGLMRRLHRTHGQFQCRLGRRPVAWLGTKGWGPRIARANGKCQKLHHVLPHVTHLIAMNQPSRPSLTAFLVDDALGRDLESNKTTLIRNDYRDHHTNTL